MRRRRVASFVDRRSGIGVVVVLVAAGCGNSRTEIRSGIAIEHVDVVDVVRARTMADMTVVVDGMKITAAQPASGVALGDSVVRVNGAGKYLIPGLWDMHVHAMEGDDPLGLPLFIANGVTGIRDMWGDLEIAANLRTAVDAGTQVGPRWVVAGNLVDAPHPWWPPSVVAGDAERARQVVDSLSAAGAAFIKVYSLLDHETYRAILARAREIGLPVAGHVPFSVTAREASQLGQASFEHLFGVMEGCSGADETVRLERQGWLAARAAGKHDVPNPFFDVGIYRNVLDTFEDATCTALLEELAERGTWQVPTLVANRIDAYLADSAFTADPRVEYMPASATEYWQGLANAANGRFFARPALDEMLARAEAMGG